jgi:ABC-2 type transport system permease protein
MRAAVIARKTLGDFSSLKVLVPYLLVSLIPATLMANGMTNSLPADFGTFPLHHQEAELVWAFVQISFPWVIGVPALVLGAVLAANTLALQRQRGSLRILLTKPIRRRDVLLGTVLAIVAFSFLAVLATLLATLSILYVRTGASPNALGAFVDLAAPTLAYAALVTLSMAALGIFLAVLTGSRLRTVLGAMVVPALFLGFILVRLVAPTSYRDNALYLVDVSYHYGNVYVWLHNTLGSGFTPPTASTLGISSGVYDDTAVLYDPLLGGMPAQLEPIGHLSPTVSLALLVGGTVLLLALSLVQFERADIS